MCYLTFLYLLIWRLDFQQCHLQTEVYAILEEEKTLGYSTMYVIVLYRYIHIWFGNDKYY